MRCRRTAWCSATCGPPARAPCAGWRRCRCRCRPRRANPSSNAEHNEGLFTLGECSAARATTRSSCTAAMAFDNMNYSSATTAARCTTAPRSRQGDPPRQHLGRGRRRPVHDGDAALRRRCRAWQAVLRPPDDHLQPPPYTFPAGRGPWPQGQAQRGGVHRPGGRRFSVPRQHAWFRTPCS